MCLLKSLYRQWRHMPFVGGGPAVMPDLATMDYNSQNNTGILIDW